MDTLIGKKFIPSPCSILNLNCLKFNKLYLIISYVWIGGQTWTETLNTTNSTRLPLNALSLSVESNSDPQFVRYLSSLSLVDHNSLPLTWFHAFYQQRFSCHLPHSPVIDTRFESMCTGEERIQAMDGMHSDTTAHTIQLVYGRY